MVQLIYAASSYIIKKFCLFKGEKKIQLFCSYLLFGCYSILPKASLESKDPNFMMVPSDFTAVKSQIAKRFTEI